mmetsp:Transcript_13973/g.31678  ORF Transcript_13973/g.31678 Transcript_13973/m.31678 type:complete len:325 (-) Transcript_13973:78-1052(-)
MVCWTRKLSRRCVWTGAVIGAFLHSHSLRTSRLVRPFTQLTCRAPSQLHGTRCFREAAAQTHPSASGAESALELGAISESRFCHGWSIHQLEAGYRYCADDVLCAHFALRAAPFAKNMLDLGSGIGTIGLLWLAQQPKPWTPAMVTMMEAQTVSVELCRRTLEKCGIPADVVRIVHGDLRDKPVGRYDVITANPPYMKRGSGNLPRNVQKAHCRHELRGSLRDFCQAAAEHLTANGTFCLILNSPREAEAMDIVTSCGLRIWERKGVFFRGARKSFALICRLSTASTDVAGPLEAEDVHVFEPDGSWSPGYLQYASSWVSECCS